MRHVIVALLVLAATLPATTRAQVPHTHQHGFENAESWARYFDDPARDEWQKPHEVIRHLDLAPDAKVADIGAGTGYFAVRLARMTPNGTVYAVDVEPDMVKYLAERAAREKLANLEAVQASAADPQLPAKVDRVLLVDVYHHIADRERYFGRLKASLAPQAQVAIVDFRMDSPVGPPRSARVTEAEVVGEMERAGYAVLRRYELLPNQFYLVFVAR
jgi:cyclopropane fatty-acyl-phospholipid synthase-like methyltransferase